MRIDALAVEQREVVAEQVLPAAADEATVEVPAEAASRRGVAADVVEAHQADEHQRVVDELDAEGGILRVLDGEGDFEGPRLEVELFEGAVAQEGVEQLGMGQFDVEAVVELRGEVALQVEPHAPDEELRGAAVVPFVAQLQVARDAGQAGAEALQPRDAALQSGRVRGGGPGGVRFEGGRTLGGARLRSSRHGSGGGRRVAGGRRGGIGRRSRDRRSRDRSGSGGCLRSGGRVRNCG